MDPLNLAGVIGTWVAAGLAVVALVGIVGPLLLLREKRSERFKALNSIDSQNTGYIRNGLKLRGKDRFFLKVKAPLLKDPPNPGKHFREIVLLKDSDNARLQKERSRTGWVNLAAIIDAYTSDVPKGDVLIIRQKQSWLPVHRFWLLAFGLLGRYSDREDHGEAFDENNASRLMIEEEVDRKDGWESNPTAVKLYGSTGTLWWRCKLDESDVSTDEAYFVPHSEDHAQEIYPEPMPLSQLFWLALGCLPLGSGKDDVVFDLTSFKRNYNSRHRPGSPTQSFYKFMARGPLGISTVHRNWAEAMGVNLEKLYCIQQVLFPSDWTTAATDADANKGPWFRYRGSSQDYLWRSDVYRQILGLLHMHVSPKGALFDHSRYGSSVFEVPERNISRLLERMHSDSCLSNLSTDEAAILGRMRELWPQNESALDDELYLVIIRSYPFSRKQAQASYDFDIVHQGRHCSAWIQDIVGILTLTSDDFFNTLLLDQPDATIQEIEIAANCVKIKFRSGTLMEDTFDLSEVFAIHLAENSNIQITYPDPTAILFSALSACVKAFCFRSLLDSSKLIRLIHRMDEIVHVAASSHIPMLPILASTGGADNGRRVATHRQQRRSPPVTFIRNTPALTPQIDFDNEIEQHFEANNDGSPQPSLRSWPSPPPISPGSEEAMRPLEMAEHREREWHGEQNIILRAPSGEGPKHQDASAGTPASVGVTSTDSKFS